MPYNKLNILGALYIGLGPTEERADTTSGRCHSKIADEVSVAYLPPHI